MVQGVAGAILTPATFFIVRRSYRRLPFPKPSEATALRTSAILTGIAASTAIFALATQLLVRHVGSDDAFPHDAAIALDFVMIPTLAIAAAFGRRRYLVARGRALAVV
jgi:hypothetical protein